MANLDVSALGYRLPGGQVLLDDVSFRVAPGEHVGLIGANGVGKTTLLRVLAGDEAPTAGAVAAGGPLVWMRQWVGEGDGTVRQLYLSLSPERYRAAAERLEAAERRLAREPGDDASLRYARALTAWEDIGGYDLEVWWAASATRAVGLPWTAVADRPVGTFSGGERKQLALELLFGSEYPILLLDEPDNFLDIPHKAWLASEIRRSAKTILFVSHDRELLADAAHKVVTLEARGAWTHGGSFDGWAEARDARQARIDDEHRRWADERKRLVAHMRTMKARAAQNDANASRARAAETRLRHFDQAGPPPERVRDQQITMALRGGRSGKRV
ncbi:MAG: ATP-binding cassette domain-containing protein, partial [Acidimicrobiia bacterium]|nr:ATP-binding cassette domain-containing protein [Acidimicrobiia bacterium]